MFALRIRAPEDRIRMHLPTSVARLDAADHGDLGNDESVWYRAEVHAEHPDWIPQVIVRLGCEVVG